MAFPTNDTGLSVLGVIKWLLIIGSLGPFFKAYQGLILQETATGYGVSSAAATQVLVGGEAVKFGLQNLGLGILLLGAAWALWFFWQRYED